MKKVFLAILFLTLASAAIFVGCEKSETGTGTITNPTDRRGNGNGRGNNTGGTTGGTTTTTSNDSLLRACGITLSDTGSWYPTVQVNNIRWRKVTGYSYDPATGGNTYPYDILVIEFDAPVITGKTVNCYMLEADQCQGRVVCNKMNGINLSQVTTCNTTTQFWLPIGVTWLNPYVTTYTGVISVGTTDGCIYMSQPFSFEPPRILQLY